MRNVQRCTGESMQRFQGIAQELMHFNQLDMQTAKDFKALGDKYKLLEDEGDRYLASQNSDGSEEDESDAVQPVNVNTNSLYPTVQQNPNQGQNQFQPNWNPQGLSMEQYAQQNPNWQGGFDYGQYNQNYNQNYNQPNLNSGVPAYMGQNNNYTFNYQGGVPNQFSQPNFGVFGQPMNNPYSQQNYGNPAPGYNPMMQNQMNPMNGMGNYNLYGYLGRPY
jgi:hypothetical protein